MSSPSRRARRRRQARREVKRLQALIGADDLVNSAAANWKCPDCNSEHRGFHTDEDGLLHLTIAHDDGCPFLEGITP